MTLFDFIRLIYRNSTLIAVVAISMALVVFLLTRNTKKQYVSEAVIYTGIASGFNIESGEQSKVDYHAINNAFDNLMTVIKSRVTLEEVSLRLLATHLHQDRPSLAIIGTDFYEDLNATFPLDLKAKVQDTTVDRTFIRLKTLFDTQNEYLNDLLEQGESPYSIKTLKTISTKRNKSSDMIELAYISSDPAVARMTLDLMLEVFARRYRDIKESETGDVVAYFQQELAKVKSNLVEAENRLTEFRVNSRVINYVEQTKAIAFKKQNALEDYAMKKMNLKATESALTEIEKKLEMREKLLSKNVELLAKKNRLTELTSAIAYSELNEDSTANITALINEQESLKKAISKDVELLFDFQNTREGLPSKQLLNDWLNNLIQLNKEKVNVALYSQRLREIDAEYDRMAPMGSTISRLEREIDVFEREYLEVLHGLNMAKLRQQNIQMSSNLEVLDKPKFPRKALASKSKLLIIAACLFGIIGTLSMLVAREMLDQSFKNPLKAEKQTKLQIAGAFPVVNDRLHKKHEGAFDQTLSMAGSKVLMQLSAQANSDTNIVLIMSTKDQQGKSFVGKMLLHELSQRGEKACLLTTNKEEDKGENIFNFNSGKHLTACTSLDQLVSQDLSTYSIILLEVPAWVKAQVPTHIIKKASLSLWVAKASDRWSQTYQNMLTDFSQFSKLKPMFFINGIKPYYLDQVIGDVPAKRNSFITRVRKICKFEFSSVQFNTF